MELTIRRFEQPDDHRAFPFGSFELVRLGGMTIGRASYAPGWKWSEQSGRRRAPPSARWNTWGSSCRVGRPCAWPTASSS